MWRGGGIRTSLARFSSFLLFFLLARPVFVQALAKWAKCRRGPSAPQNFWCVCVCGDGGRLSLAFSASAETDLGCLGTFCTWRHETPPLANYKINTCQKREKKYGGKRFPFSFSFILLFFASNDKKTM
jgi:hypothetical protein